MQQIARTDRREPPVTEVATVPGHTGGSLSGRNLRCCLLQARSSSHESTVFRHLPRSPNAPLATELAEKFNSIFWMRDGKDSLALGNMTGAMIFQSTIPVTFGILFSLWSLAPLDAFAAAPALASGGFAYLMLRRSKKLQAWHLMVGGAFYLAFVAGAVLTAL
jgi:hypothetical protein